MAEQVDDLDRPRLAQADARPPLELVGDERRVDVPGRRLGVDEHRHARRGSAIGFADAMNVSVGTSTSSPGPTPRTRSATWSAAVPLAQATAWRAPT